VSEVAWACAAVVGVVFVWAGMSKLQFRGEWSVQARQLGAPGWISAPLPIVEVALGAALILGWQPIGVVPAAIALLTAFTALIMRNLLGGRRPPCACFGVRAARPISWWSVVRNLVFIALLLVALLVN
jgi:hypothetical protein